MTDRLSSDDKKRMTDAATWHVRLHEGAATESDFLAFERWVSDPENRAAYNRVEDALVTVEAFPREFAAPSAIAPRRIGPVFWTAAAGLAMAAAIILFVVLRPPAPAWASYDAPPNAARDVTLADGSTLHLNRRAHVQVAFTPRERRVRMQGEVAFEVAHNASQPFLIDVGDQRVRVVGTEFDVLHANDATQVTVRRGVVEVALARGIEASVRLQVGEQSLHREGSSTIDVRRVDPETAFAWRTGRLIYADASLSQVVADLNRYYDKPIRVADPSAAALRFSGVLVIDTEANVVARLQAFLPVTAETTAEDVTLHARQAVHRRRQGP